MPNPEREGVNGECDEHQNIVLRHMRRKEDFAPRMHGRNERDKHRQPAAREKRGFLRADSATFSRRLPQPKNSREINGEAGDNFYQ